MGAENSAEVSGLTYEQTSLVLERIAPALSDLVLVGGQAVNFWAGLYRSTVPELTAGPYTSKDIDFQGSKATAVARATYLGGRVVFPSSDDHAPSQTAKVVFQIDGADREIDFLGSVCGLDSSKVAENALPIDVLDESGNRTGQRFFVMHPVDCLVSRVSNVAVLPKYDTPHSVQQLKAAVVCAREFIRVVAETSRVRPALKLSERIFRYALHERNATRVHQLHGVEVLDAVFPHKSLGAPFRDQRYPRMLEQVAAKRSKWPPHR